MENSSNRKQNNVQNWAGKREVESRGEALKARLTDIQPPLHFRMGKQYRDKVNAFQVGETALCP